MIFALALAVASMGHGVSADQSRDVLDAFSSRIGKATTLSVTVTETTEEFPRPVKTRWWCRQGGYYRYESPQGTFIASPERCWSYKPTGKAYMVFPGAPRNWTLSRAIGLGEFGDRTDMPTIGKPTTVTWHGRPALRIEVDGRRTMSKETKLYFYFDPKTHNQTGVSANLGSITQVKIYTDLKINPKIPDSTFRFVPPKGWKLVKG